MKRNGFSLIEVLVATVFLTAVLTTLLSSLVSASRWSKTHEVTAANIVRGDMNPLYEAVNADTMDSPNSDLAIGNHTIEAKDMNGKTFTRAYEVKSVDINGDGVEDYRQAKGTVSWTEADDET